eukprot:TRINITY_DN48537_c0_g1_i1.p1 TRINITY_DN48537_c0_g1~~TRINITY_DN48537_c0_g1_i1.p1  ORF type:complete len:834 (-),score=290.30 TRINITY_DN48537_c0_g1_i1:107-2608(-)
MDGHWSSRASWRCLLAVLLLVPAVVSLRDETYSVLAEVELTGQGVHKLLTSAQSLGVARQQHDSTRRSAAEALGSMVELRADEKESRRFTTLAARATTPDDSTAVAQAATAATATTASPPKDGDGSAAAGKDGQGVEDPASKLPYGIKGVSGNALKVFGVIMAVFVTVVVVVTIRSWSVAAAEDAAHSGDAGQGAEGVGADGSAEAQHPQQEDPELKELKRQRFRLLTQQAVAKRKLEKLIDEIVRLEYEKQSGAPLSDAELRRKAKEALESSDILTQRSLVSAVAYAAPFMMQGQKVYSTVEQRLQQAQDKAQKLLKEESEGMYLEIKESLNLQGISAGELMSDLQVPKLAILLASAIAPMQLNVIHAANLGNIVAMAIFVLVNLLVLVVDSNRGCWSTPNVFEAGMTMQERAKTWLQNTQTNLVYGWTSIDFFINVFFFLIRLRFFFMTKQIVSKIETPPPVSIVDNPVRAFRLLVDFHVSTGGIALLALDEVGKSVLFQLASWTTVFNFAWMIFAISIVLNVPWGQCKNIGLLVLRIRVLLFLMFFLPMILSIALFVAGLVLQSSSFAMSLLRAANLMDKAVGLGVPIFKILAYSLLFRSVDDMLEIQITAQRCEKDRLTTEKAELEKSLAELQASLEQNDSAAGKTEGEIQRLEEEQLAAGHASNQEQLDAQFRQIKDELLGDSEAFFKKIHDRSRELAEEAAARGEEIDVEQLVGEASASANAVLATAQASAQEAAKAANNLATQAKESGLQASLNDAAAAAKAQLPPGTLETAQSTVNEQAAKAASAAQQLQASGSAGGDAGGGSVASAAPAETVSGQPADSSPSAL